MYIVQQFSIWRILIFFGKNTAIYASWPGRKTSSKFLEIAYFAHLDDSRLKLYTYIIYPYKKT